ncbi:hypothetical protein QBC43DRAFT_204568 [Cladorrhinum sp. PSN259]|nr:hypothetical protein QBC43DRAFT_204568 [Cladorrhinum sp. PSN259]
MILSTLTTAATGLLLAGSAIALPESAAPAAGARISSIQYSGNGCLRDPKVSGGLADPTFTYQNFAASLPGTNQTLNCEVHLSFTGTGAGWQVALNQNNVRGHVVLGAGTRLDYFTTVFFSESAAKTSTVRGSITNSNDGTLDQGVTLVNNLGGNKVWSQCTGSSGYTGILNVNFRGALSGSGRAYFEALTENWDLEWRRC